MRQSGAMADFSEPAEEQPRRTGLRVRFGPDLTPAISFENDAIIHVCPDRVDHWFVYSEDPGVSVPFLEVTPSRHLDMGTWSEPPRLFINPSRVGPWRYYCGATELLPNNPPFPREASTHDTKFKQGGAEWITRGFSGVAMYIDTLEDWPVTIEERRRTLDLPKGDSCWIEMFAARPAYPLLEVFTESLRLSYPAAVTWWLSSLEQVSKYQVEQTGNKITFLRPLEVHDPQPWRQNPGGA